MTRFAYLVRDGQAEPVDPDYAMKTACAFAWVHLDGRAEDNVAWIDANAGVDRLVADALVATETRPRTEFFANGALINLRGRSSEELRLSDPLASLRLYAARGRVISASRLPLVAIPPVRAAVDAGKVTDPGDLIAALAGAITADLDPEVAELGDSLDDCEQNLDAARVFELRRGVTKVRVAAINYRRFLSPQRAALEKLAQLPGDWLADDDRVHLNAAADRAARMAEELEAIRERANLMHEALTDLRAEQLDQRGLIISIAAMVFLPLTFITGLYGMNVEGLWFAKEPWAFDAIVALCAVIAAGVTGYFVTKHWFR